MNLTRLIEAFWVWVGFGSVTGLLILWIKKPAKDVPIIWPLIVVGLGPIGLVYFFVLAFRAFRTKMAKGGLDR